MLNPQAVYLWQKACLPTPFHEENINNKSNHNSQICQLYWIISLYKDSSCSIMLCPLNLEHLPFGVCVVLWFPGLAPLVDGDSVLTFRNVVLLSFLVFLTRRFGLRFLLKPVLLFPSLIGRDGAVSASPVTAPYNLWLYSWQLSFCCFHFWTFFFPLFSLVCGPRVGAGRPCALPIPLFKCLSL